MSAFYALLFFFPRDADACRSRSYTLSAPARIVPRRHHHAFDLLFTAHARDLPAAAMPRCHVAICRCHAYAPR